MIQSTLITCYTSLCFCIEGAFCAYLSHHKNHGNVVALFKKIDTTVIKNDDIENGLEILRNVRNSFHGSHGRFVYAYADKTINYMGKQYKFNNGQLVSVSYEFLRDFVPNLTDVYIKIFSSNKSPS